MSEKRNTRSWFAAAAIAAPLLALAAASTGPGSGPGSCPQAGACAQEGGCPQAGACPGGMHGGRMHGGHRHAAWDAGAVTQVQGKVEEVQTVGPGGHGTHLVLSVGSDRLEVRVGPSGWLAEQGMKVEKGDVLEVKGVRIERGGTPVVVAQELRKGDRVVTLRDPDGTPRWAAPRAN